MPQDAFTFIFVSDLEMNYRGHTEQDVADIMQEIVDLKAHQAQSFDGEYRHQKINPELVIHGGDSYESDYHEPNTEVTSKQYYTPLNDNGIAFMTTDGNHDEVSRWAGTAKFVENAYGRVSHSRPHYAGGYAVKFKGLQIASFDHSAMGPSETQTAAMLASPWLDTAKPIVVINHKPAGNSCSTALPIAAGDLCYDKEANKLKGGTIHGFPGLGAPWGSYCKRHATDTTLWYAPVCSVTRPEHILSDGTNGDVLHTWVKQFQDNSAVFSGHTHTSNIQDIDANKKEYTAPYPHKWGSMTNGEAETRTLIAAGNEKQRAMLAVLVSPTQGVLSVKQIDTKLRSRNKRDGDRCFSKECDQCENGHSYWHSKSFTACGEEPRWPDGKECFAGTSCGACERRATWWPSKGLFGWTACGNPKLAHMRNCLGPFCV